jgi:ribosomal protein S18 acetylase RimI-like enzyme
VSVTLRPMLAEEYPAFVQMSRHAYVQDMVEHGGMPPSAAEAKADRDFALVLPDGLDTPGHWIFVIEAAGAAVGRLWFAERVIDGRTAAFLYDIHIDFDHRGRGHGRAAMLAFEQEAARRGLEHLMLNVFGGNRRARGLYRSLGYAETAVQMAKRL